MASLPFNSLDATLAEIFQRTGPRLVAAAPLGLGKPHRLLNALYDAVAGDPSRSLQLYTALSLTPPSAGSGLQRRFLQPFLARHFGEDFPALKYVQALHRDALPENIRVEEFYLQSGAMLGSHQAQQEYASLNYTHVARAVAARGINMLVQKVAREPNGARLSLSCNPDLTFDLLDEVSFQGKPRPLMVAEIDPNLPYIAGTACVDAGFFDLVLELPGPAPKLFALPRQPVSDADYAIGLYASALVKDGGTLQIGIGSLSEALCHALILRHTRPQHYRLLLDSLSPGYADSALVRETGGTGSFEQGLYGASEMVNDGFMRLAQAGILKRRVIDDVEAMRRINTGRASLEDDRRLEAEGRWLDGGFYLGSHDLYDWLRDLPEAEKRGIGMTRISHINELYGGSEALERLQRREARFFNTCMMMTALGAAASDALADGRVVSGVGGQYNFVAMAHALRDGRSVLMFRATRETGAVNHSCVLWNYGHTTIPRHLRDIAVTEYGVADLRGASDGSCIERMLGLCDAHFQTDLMAEAKRAGKLSRKFSAAPAWSGNRAERLKATLRPYRQMGLLPEYPFGSDFTPVEQRLVRALGWLQSATATPIGKVRTIATAMVHAGATDRDALQRMQLAEPKGFGERLEARLVMLALARTAL
jgi:acyl-CoA hydrolase